MVGSKSNDDKQRLENLINQATQTTSQLGGEAFRKLNTGVWLAIFFIGSFVLIMVSLFIPPLEFNLGGIFVALFVIGMFLIGWNTLRAGRRLSRAQEPAPKTPATSAPSQPPTQEQHDSSQQAEQKPAAQ